MINAISVRRVAGLADDTVELRLRSLRLVAGWVLILSLGLTLTKTYAGQGTTYAAVWMPFEILSIPVIVLLLTWWRLEIRKVLLDLPALPGWLQKSAQHSGGLKGYLFTALGGLYLVFIFSRQFFVRQLSHFEGGREIVVMLIGRELNREYERKIQSDEISPISQALTSELLDNKGLVAAKIFKRELRKLGEIVE